jgi:nucleotide-binding universal stress UspA family protein
MESDGRPIVVAFDGSPEAVAAVRAATELMPGRRLLVATVWEPGLAAVSIAPPDSLGMSYLPPDPEQVEAVDRAEQDHARTTAEAGVRLAQDLGARAEAVPLPDDADVATVIMGLAEQHDAAAVVVGRRGLGAIRSTVFGSTSRGLLDTARRPVLVVHPDERQS